MSNIAILGHPTRGIEVIEILEMLGGINLHDYSADCDSLCFYKHKDTEIIYYDWINNCNEDEDIFVFTLEEFLEKFPYKIWDKVRHKGATSCGTIYVIEQMKWEDNQVKYVICDLYWKNRKCTVTAKDLQPYKEETIEDNIKETCDLINFNSHHIFAFADRVELVLKDDWEVKNEGGRTYVVRKQPKKCGMLSMRMRTLRNWLKTVKELL